MWDSDSATSEWPDAGFPGVRINPLTLLPEITSVEECQAALAASEASSDRIFVLLVEGDAATAAELLAAGSEVCGKRGPLPPLGSWSSRSCLVSKRMR